MKCLSSHATSPFRTARKTEPPLCCMLLHRQAAPLLKVFKPVRTDIKFNTFLHLHSPVFQFPKSQQNPCLTAWPLHKIIVVVTGPGRNIHRSLSSYSPPDLAMSSTSGRSHIYCCNLLYIGSP
jgi:hypothetical protein